MKGFENKGYLLQLCLWEANPYFQFSSYERLSTNTTFSPSKYPQENLLSLWDNLKGLVLDLLLALLKSFQASTLWDNLLGIHTEIPEKDVSCVYLVVLWKALPPREDLVWHKMQHPGQSKRSDI